MDTPQLNCERMCQENAGNLADDCLPWARIAILAILVLELHVELHFRLPPMTYFSAVTIRITECVKLLVLGACESTSTNLKAFKSYSRSTEGVHGGQNGPRASGW
jgi:hypothetical protein